MTEKRDSLSERSDLVARMSSTSGGPPGFDSEVLEVEPIDSSSNGSSMTTTEATDAEA